MNKNLRLFMTALLCAVLGTAWGQDVTLDFTENNWGLPEGSSNKATTAANFSNGTYTITLEATTGYYYNTGYLMLGKNGSSLTLPAFNFAVGTIEVVGNSGGNASTNTVENIFVGENAVSDQQVGSASTNTFAIAADYQAAGNIYTLKILSNHNAQITQIKIYKAGGQTVKPTPNMSFSPTSISVVVGDDFAAPVLTYEGDGTVTYSSDNEAVATVDASTGEVDVVAAGTANITASAPETANWKEASASYKITAADPQGTHEIVDGVFDFTDGTAYGSGLAPSTYSDPDHAYETEPSTWTAGNITLEADGKYRWWFNVNGNTLRFYNNVEDEVQTSRMTISAPSGSVITSIQITGGQQFVSDDGLYTSSNGKWEGEAQSVTLRYAASSGNVAVKTVTVTYTNGETPSEKQTPTMKFTPNYVNFFLGGTFTAPELTYDGDGTVTYASSNEEVATVDASTGAVTIKNVVGKATIKATATETDNYEAAEASYTINVAEQQNTHEVVDGTFNFTDATDYGSGLTPSDDGNEYIYEPSTWTAGNVVLNVEGKYRWWLNASGNTLRLYNNLVEEEQTTKITLSVPAGKKINKIDFTGDAINFTADSGEFANGAWTGDAQTVVLTYNATKAIQIKTITVDYGGNRIDPAFAWSAESATATLGEAFTAPTLSYAQGFNGEITYTSSNENVATISATGAVTIVGAGTTTIKATTPSTPDYLESSASYTLTVTDPAATDVTYDFTGENDYGTELAPSNDGALYIYDDYTWKNDPVSLVTSGKYRWWAGTGGNTLRLYSNKTEEGEETTKLTFSVPAGKSITAIEFVVGVNDAFTANVGEFGGKSWAGDAQSVELTLANGKPYISTIKVTYKDASGILLGDANDDGAVNITDVTVAVNYVLTKDPTLINLTNADVNQDGEVNITDVTNIVNIILSSSN